jgi:hypothetical protein
VYDQFEAELNPKLKPQVNVIEIKPNLIYNAISQPVRSK